MGTASVEAVPLVRSGMSVVLLPVPVGTVSVGAVPVGRVGRPGISSLLTTPVPVGVKATLESVTFGNGVVGSGGPTFGEVEADDSAEVPALGLLTGAEGALYDSSDDAVAVESVFSVAKLGNPVVAAEATSPVISSTELPDAVALPDSELSGAVMLSDSDSVALPVAEVSEAVMLSDPDSVALPVAEVSGAVIASDPDSVALPVAEVSGAVIASDSDSVALPVAEVSGAVIASDSDSVALPVAELSGAVTVSDPDSDAELPDAVTLPDVIELSGAVALSDGVETTELQIQVQAFVLVFVLAVVPDEADAVPAELSPVGADVGAPVDSSPVGDTVSGMAEVGALDESSPVGVPLLEGAEVAESVSEMTDVGALDEASSSVADSLPVGAEESEPVLESASVPALEEGASLETSEVAMSLSERTGTRPVNGETSVSALGPRLTMSVSVDSTVSVTKTVEPDALKSVSVASVSEADPGAVSTLEPGPVGIPLDAAESVESPVGSTSVELPEDLRP